MCEDTVAACAYSKPVDMALLASISRRKFLQATGALLAAGATLPAAASAVGQTVSVPLHAPAEFPTHPNILILITDQERAPQHWPAGWGDANLPNRKRLADHGLTFTRACCNAGMCSPSRATTFTGLYPATHGVTYTLTSGGTHAPLELELPLTIQNMAKLLGTAGYTVQYRGKWHMSRGSDEGDPTPADLAAYGFNGWVPPEAGENADPEGFGGGCTAWDVQYTDEAVNFLTSAAADGPEPWALVVSLVNPHDVLAYPRTWNRTEDGGCSNYKPAAPACFQQGISLPPTIEEDLAANYKPTAQRQTLTMLNFGLGTLNPLTNDRERYVNFYAYLQTVVDARLGAVLDALDAKTGLSEKTVVIRFADHGELGLSHGGLRQKMFNAYEENLRIPLVVANPVLFPAPVQSTALAALVDLMPTLATLAHVPNPAQWTFQGKDLMPVVLDAAQNPANPTVTVQDNTLYTFDDESAGAADGQVIVTQPNHLRCLREARWKYVLYFDPTGIEASQQELYDLESDPNEEHNQANAQNTAYYNPAQLTVMQTKLTTKMVETRTLPYHAWLPAIEKQP